MANDITFFRRFQDDIMAGRKTITLRDKSESHFVSGQRLRTGCYEDDLYFCTIEVISVTAVSLAALNEHHARQENMTLEQLKQVIEEIYPGEQALWEIAFKVVTPI
ncbi:N(4)-acetylcytidine aminohydrolase [Citrobacter sp. JGM124]|uniref:N(4)-acetylcytidine aminohydrolase n=1 Tax=Citrobacter sp. JGM124 TaxID=2799789 RepID=UPI001BA64280|nr:N(4)-acetylcytidine aminohydrolase [Citrobacter sp. JGM124]MBS0847374.1 ASCH domain-containing protein [Citrobacter sp. JGM124]